jgi:nicotinamidase-related amidase
LLRNLGIDTLLMCGVVTNGRVEGTCAAVTPALHQAAITNLKDAFCNCRSTQDVVAELASRRPE